MLNKISLFFIIPSLLILSSWGITEKDNSEITPETALQSYLHNGDQSFEWEVKESYTVGETKAYDLLLTSQKWREHLWTHQLTIIVPKQVNHDGTLLYVTGGSATGNEPNWSSNDNKDTKNFADIATKNKAIVAIVRQTPKQPLYGGLSEDQLISFTLHNFKNDKDYSWPLLFPMVKTAVSAMTAVQEFSKQQLQQDINRFTVTGKSKRGWTTWLTGASDKRVEAIAPMVIDVLNMPVSIDYQLEAWQEYSIQIEDYTKLGIPQAAHSKDGMALSQMVDPYSYREKLTMPKLIFIGTNDEYWPVDAIKNYIEDIPGINFVHYVPNEGHDLGDGKQSRSALSAFWGKTLNKDQYNDIAYTISANKTSTTLKLASASDDIVNVYAWSTDSTDRDFRDENWTAKKLKLKKSGLKYKVEYPQSGYRAFYIDIEYSDPNGGTYTKSTRMYLLDDDELL